MHPSLEIHQVGDTQSVSPIQVYYRETTESRVHAIGAELRLDGVCAVQLRPIHCLGATPSKIKAWQKWALTELSQLYGKDVGKYRGSVELHPSQCPLCKYESERDPERIIAR
jgi:hypothetical protein